MAFGLQYKINSATSNIVEGHAELWPGIQDGRKCAVISCEWHTDEEGGKLKKSEAENSDKEGKAVILLLTSRKT